MLAQILTPWHDDMKVVDYRAVIRPATGLGSAKRVAGHAVALLCAGRATLLSVELYARNELYAKNHFQEQCTHASR